MKILSMHRPLPSMEMATPASSRVAVNSKAGELAALVRVALQGFREGVCAEPGIVGVGQPPGEHPAGGSSP